MAIWLLLNLRGRNIHYVRRVTLAAAIIPRLSTYLGTHLTPAPYTPKHQTLTLNP